MSEVIHRRPTDKFFEGQKPPEFPMFSQDNIDWYKEQIRRCREGFEFRGTRFTGDQWWFYNLCPMPVLKLDKWGNPTKDFSMGFPYWSQEDDYLFKQIEEADQDDKTVMFFTGRGYGKTQIVLSIGGKIYFLKKGDSDDFGVPRVIHGIISASGEAHAIASQKKFSILVDAVNKAHPSIELTKLNDTDSWVICGESVIENGKVVNKPRAQMEMIAYGIHAGKTKGRRVDFQLYEESGDWAQNASLKDCISASRGTMWVGNTKVCRDFIIGTGGTVLSSQAKEIAMNPESFEIYTVRDHADRKTCIIIPAYKKFGGFWEKTGFSDYEGAKAEIEKIRAIKKLDPDPSVYNKYIQEYPFTIDEMFMQGSGNRFDLEKIGARLAALDIPENRLGEYGNLEWIRDKDGAIKGVEWVPSNTGKMWLLEPPEINPETGKPYRRLYVGGYDGIDVGIKEKVTKTGSSGSLVIKKRMLSAQKTNNVRVFYFVDKPKEIDDWFEGCLKACVFFNLVGALNIEDTKRGIVGFFRNNKFVKGYHFFMPRPRLTLPAGMKKKENDSNLIGTTSDPKNYEHAENFLIRYIKDYHQNMYYRPGLMDNRDFNMSERTKHDITVAEMMAELADDEFMDQPVERRTAPVVHTAEYGYYTDSRGIKRWGEIPKKIADRIRFQQQERIPDVIDRRGK